MVLTTATERSLQTTWEAPSRVAMETGPAEVNWVSRTFTSLSVGRGSYSFMTQAPMFLDVRLFTALLAKDRRRLVEVPRREKQTAAIA